MSYYTPTGNPLTLFRAASSTERNEFSLIKNAFDSAQADIALKAPFASPSFTGVPTAPTPAAGTNTAQIATMAAVNQAITVATSGTTAAAGLGYGLSTFYAGFGTYSSTIRAVSIDVLNAPLSSYPYVDLASDGTVTKIKSSHTGAASTLPLVFDVDGERMRIDTSGNIGIGAPNGGGYGKVGVYGTGYVSSFVQALDASGVVLINAANAASDARIGTVSNHPLYVLANGALVAQFPASGGFIAANAVLATNTTAGFFGLPTCAGAPSGAPNASYSNSAAAIIDTSTGTGKLWVRINGTWRGVALT